MDLEGTIDGRFVLERRVGAGGAGAVYRARDDRTGRAAALKLVPLQDPRSAERFAREAALLADFEHPHVVRHVAHGITPERFGYLAMEWLEGEDLAQRLARAALPLDDARAILAGAASALGAAHARGIVHRDVKPSNLFLPAGAATAVTLLDFGVAYAPAPHRALTGSHTILGTPGYMAPEQARGERSIGPAADVFALGAVAFECLTGQRAFAGRDRLPVLMKVIFDEPPDVRELRPEIDADLAALVSAMLAKRAADRPADGASVLRALEALDLGARTTRPARTTSSSLIARSVVLVRDASRDTASALTLRPGEHSPAEDARLWQAQIALGRRGSHIARLADGVWMAVEDAATSPAAQAAASAHTALTLRGILPEARIAGVVLPFRAGASRPLSDALAPARELLDRARPGVIALDAALATALGAEFEIDRSAPDPVLRAVRAR